MYLETHAVAQAVLEMLAVPGVADHVARRGVHVPDVGARPRGLDPGPLRGRDQLVDLPLPAGGLAQRDGAGHVGVVAAVAGAEVHRDQVTAAQRPVGRRVVRDRAVRPAGHDRVEGRAFRAEVGHPRFQRRRQPAFGQTRPDQREHVGDGLAADPARGGEQLKLVRILDRAELLDLPPERDDGDALGGGREFRVALDGHLVRLEGDGAPTPAGHLGGEARFDEAFGQELHVGAVPPGGQCVPRVGGQHRLPGGRDQQCGVRAGQAGEVTDVRRRGDQHRVRARLGDLLLYPRAARRVNLRHALNFTRPTTLGRPGSARD